jgi:hypothetical protein
MVFIEELWRFIHGKEQLGFGVVHLNLDEVVAGEIDEEEGEVDFLLPLVNFALVAVPLEDLLDDVLL